MPSRSLVRSMGPVLALALASGCYQVGLGAHDAGPGDGGAPMPCGPTICGAGLVCCNESCGICTLPGQGCTAIACVLDAGLPDGGPISCGGPMRAPCPMGSWCDFPDESVCGSGGEWGECRPSFDVVCPPEVRPVCGCDGRDYSSPCDAFVSGTDYAFEGRCSPCSPDDARGIGMCEAEVGYAWDGMICTALTGCDCEGSDCWRYGSIEQCVDEHLGCNESPVHARIDAACAPFDGRAWSFALTYEPERCGATSAGRTLHVEVWADLDRTAGMPHVAELDGSFDVGGGAARLCDPMGLCSEAYGVFTVHFFAAGELARFSYELTVPDLGATLVASDVEASTWCSLDTPCL